VETVRPLLAARDHRFQVVLPSGRIPLLADPTRLEQVLVNLLTNAAKYTEPGGEIILSAEPTEDVVVIRVRDTGIGIAPELLPRVFDLYMQANPGDERSAKGLGIGLWLVRRLVEEHSGTIAARSDGPGHGSEFTVRLPLDSSGAEPVPARTISDPPAVLPARARARRVLIVDDHADSAEVLARLMRRWNHETSVVHDGLSALAEAQRFRPDLVLLDLKLQGMDGDEVARRLRESSDGSTPEIIALSGLEPQRNGNESAVPLFDHQLLKPVDPVALRRLIEETAAGKMTKPE
jgi:CheY-like chemotaxis protein